LAAGLLARGRREPKRSDEHGQLDLVWRALIRPALVTGALWLVLAIFSSLYFSGVVVSDSREYGTIGVVFTLLTWFILIGMVIVLGATCGSFGSDGGVAGGLVQDPWSSARACRRSGLVAPGAPTAGRARA
jgi:hypothetical protein